MGQNREEKMKLDDKVAIITGGNSGIGKATAVLFASEGARVCITGRDEERCREVVEEIKKAKYGKHIQYQSRRDHPLCDSGW